MSYTNTSLDRFSEAASSAPIGCASTRWRSTTSTPSSAMKFTYPIRDGQRSLFMPSLRLGWTADWGNSGDSQKVSYRESGRS